MDTNALQNAKRSVRDLRRQYGHKLVDRKEFSMDPLNESADELEMVSTAYTHTHTLFSVPGCLGYSMMC